MKPTIGGDIFPRGRTFSLAGSQENWIVLGGTRYDYDVDKVTCPVCGSLGIPWAGWFHCDGKCTGIAWIETGEFMLPMPFKSVDHLDAKEPKP